MPEGDTIYRAARTLNRALAHHPVTRFETQLPALARVHDDSPVTGRTIESVESAGKWIIVRFSGDLILLTHMLMSGSWHIYRTHEPWKRSGHHMRIVIGTEQFVAVGFNVPIAEFHTAATLARHESVRRLGPDVLARDFDPEQARASLLAHPEMETGVALLRQSVIAGIGNVFKSEVCFAARVNPFRLVGTLTPAEAERLIATAQKFMNANTTASSGDQIVTYTGFRRTTGRSDPTERLWVYQRAGASCRRCGGTILVKKQGAQARVTFWCPTCQRT
jgi:endonuclease VIII